ncbi:MAG: hypothetical protein ACRYG8_08570 [Janthinobacterium lividum]
MNAELETAAKRAGLKDMDLLRLVNDGTSPQQAVADLRRRFPTAFFVDARTLSRADYKIALEEVIRDARRVGQR